jgi:hypothetical protein
VPVNYTRYQLWKPNEVQQRDNSIVVRSYDLDTSTYRDYQYKPLQAKFGVNLNVSAMSSVFTYQPILEVEGSSRYRRVAIVGRVGIGEEPYVMQDLNLHGVPVRDKFRHLTRNYAGFQCPYASNSATLVQYVKVTRCRIPTCIS